MKIPNSIVWSINFFGKTIVLLGFIFFITTNFDEETTNYFILNITIVNLVYLLDLGLTTFFIKELNHQNNKHNRRQILRDLDYIYCLLGVIGVFLYQIIKSLYFAQNSNIFVQIIISALIFLYFKNKRIDVELRSKQYFLKLFVTSNLIGCTALGFSYFIGWEDIEYFILIYTSVYPLTFYLLKTCYAEKKINDLKISSNKIIKSYLNNSFKIGLTSLAGVGLNYYIMLKVGKLFSGVELLTYLYGIRLINMINEASWSPFYSYLPKAIQNLNKKGNTFRLIFRLNLVALLFCVGGFLLPLGLEVISIIVDKNLSSNYYLLYLYLVFRLVDRINAMNYQIHIIYGKIQFFQVQFGCVVISLIIAETLNYLFPNLYHSLFYSLIFSATVLLIISTLLLVKYTNKPGIYVNHIILTILALLLHYISYLCPLNLI